MSSSLAGESSSRPSTLRTSQHWRPPSRATARTASCPAQAVYFETLTNPLLKVNDVRAISTVAHRFGALSIVDNTFVTPYLQKPLALGADVVIHSATKYLAGHSDVNAGLVVVSGEDLASRVYFAQNRLGGVLAPAECDAVRPRHSDAGPSHGSSAGECQCHRPLPAGASAG